MNRYFGNLHADVTCERKVHQVMICWLALIFNHVLFLKLEEDVGLTLVSSLAPPNISLPRSVLPCFHLK